MNTTWGAEGSSDALSYISGFCDTPVKRRMWPARRTLRQGLPLKRATEITGGKRLTIHDAKYYMFQNHKNEINNFFFLKSNKLLSTDPPERRYFHMHCQEWPVGTVQIRIIY